MKDRGIHHWKMMRMYMHTLDTATEIPHGALPSRLKTDMPPVQALPDPIIKL